MKFGKRLKKHVEESLPEWRDKFVAYKRLKRLVSAGESSTRRAAAEVVFVRMLDGEVNRFNSFFLELEQEFVIRHRVRVHVFILYERGRVAYLELNPARATGNGEEGGSRKVAQRRQGGCERRSWIWTERWCCSSTIAPSTTQLVSVLLFTTALSHSLPTPIHDCCLFKTLL
jgi:hypothetical protein